MKRLIMVASLVCALVMPVSDLAQTKPDADVSQRLDHIVQFYAEHSHFMGTILVARGEHLLLNQGYGFANLEWKLPDTPATEYALASNTKQFTAVLILRLQEEGKLSISDTLVKYVPQIPADWRAVTIQELLNHSSGVPDISGDPRFDQFAMESHTLAEQLAFLHSKPLEFTPGTKFAYSNSNYFLLAMVAEAASKQPFAALLQQTVLTPAGLKHTFFDTDTLLIPNRAQGYAFSDGEFQRTRIWSMSIGVGIGNLVSTSGDLFLWDQALFHHGLLRPESLRAMTTPGITGYGFGVLLGDINGERFVSHGGSVQGFTTWLDYSPKSDTTVVILCNSERNPSLLRDQLVDAVQGRPVFLPNEIPPAAPELSHFTGTYTPAPNVSDVPTIKVTRSGSVLTVVRGTRTGSAIYQGTEADLVRFSVPDISQEVDFLTDTKGNAIAIYLPAFPYGTLTRHPEGSEQSSPR